LLSPDTDKEIVSKELEVETPKNRFFYSRVVKLVTVTLRSNMTQKLCMWQARIQNPRLSATVRYETDQSQAIFSVRYEIDQSQTIFSVRYEIENS